MLQQHVWRQIVTDFDKSVNPFQKRNIAQQYLAKHVKVSSVEEQSKQRTRRESKVKNRRMEEIKRSKTNNTGDKKGSRDNVGHENPDSARHTKQPAAGQDACR